MEVWRVILTVVVVVVVVIDRLVNLYMLVIAS